MPVLPVYQVEHIPLERRLGDRRVAPKDAMLPPGVTVDRRKDDSRREEEQISTNESTKKSTDLPAV